MNANKLLRATKNQLSILNYVQQVIGSQDISVQEQWDPSTFHRSAIWLIHCASTAF